MANGSPAYGHHRPAAGGDGYEPFALVAVEIRGGLIGATTTYLETARLFPLFDLPTETTPPR